MSKVIPENHNMKLWNAVCTTDPDLTKTVNQRGGFTAIDAYGQIKAATKVFGPVGKGWGWEILDVSVIEGMYVITINIMYDGNTFPVVGAKKLTMQKSSQITPDEDAPKKALTDAITKGLSYIGFNADVFLGMFDDSKYVADLRFNKALQDFVEDNEDTIQTIKESIETEDLSPGAEKWFALDHETMKWLWTAPTKGGPFTTEERKVMQTPAWRKAGGQPEQ